MTDLLVDLGGTHCHVGLGDNTGLLPETVASLRNADFPDLPALLQSYLTAQRPGPLRALCAGVAGPVRGDTAQLTNHAWHIEAGTLAQATGAQTVHLLNDLQAQGYSLDTLAPDTLTPLRPGTPDPNGARLVLGLGTGCNVAVAHRVGETLFVPPAESGHTPLPDCPDLRPLFDSLRDTHPHLPIEAALYGPGLTRLHHWLTGARLTPQEVIAAKPKETLPCFPASWPRSQAPSACTTWPPAAYSSSAAPPAPSPRISYGRCSIPPSPPEGLTQSSSKVSP